VPDLRYDRLYRTATSEAYLVSVDEQPLARLELHYAAPLVYGLLLLENEQDDAALRTIIAQIDEDLVWTASVARDDFVLSVYVGREISVYDDAARSGDKNGADNGGNGGYA
jgi:hypothetical protein